MAIYLNDWLETGEDGMLGDFEITKETLSGAEVLVASYTYEDYSGDAYVLLKRGDKLFEVEGSHCSCYGLEGQWEEHETSPEAVRLRISKGSYGEDIKIKGFIAKALTDAGL